MNNIKFEILLLMDFRTQTLIQKITDINNKIQLLKIKLFFVLIYKIFHLKDKMQYGSPFFIDISVFDVIHVHIIHDS